MKRSYIFLLLASAVGFSSCVKEDQTLDPKGSTNVIEFFNEVPDVIASPTTSTYPLYLNTFEAVPGVLQDFSVTVNYTGSGAAPQDINVALELAPDATVTYNDENGEHFVDIPASLYTADSWNLTIPKGQKKASMNLKLKTAEFDFTKQYVLSVRIKSASAGTISTNYGTMLFRISAKNQYDGIYKINSGFVQRYSAPGVPTVNDGLNGSLDGNPDLTLTTIDANTVEIGNLTWHGGASGVGGINNLRATVDPATNLVTMKALGNATLANRAGMINKYDPATKTFTLNFDWNQTANVRELGVVIQYSKAR